MPSPYPWSYTLRWPLYYRKPSIKRHLDLPKVPLRDNFCNLDLKKIYKIIFCGDIMVMQRDIIPRLHPEVSGLISSADRLIGNCESPVGYHKINNTSSYKFKFFMSREYLLGIINQTNLPSSKWYLSMANNHAGDVTYQAMLDTYQIMQDLNITPLGRWHNAGPPVTTFTLGKFKFGIVAWTDWMNCEIFSKQDAGVFRKYHIDHVNWTALKKELNLNFLIALPHWEYEFQHFPSKSSRLFAKNLLLNQGMDLLVGAHTHTLQPMECFENKFCFYNLGNFCGLGVAWPVRMTPLLEIYFDNDSGCLMGYHLHIFAQINGDKKIDIVPLDLVPFKLRTKFINRLDLLYER